MQIKNLTGIRGFAALWVALFHFQSTAVVSTLNLGPVIGGGAYGVDIFFVLSGLILAINYAPRFANEGFNWNSFGDFLIRRFARIYPLHLATFLVMFVSWEVASQTSYQFHGLVVNDWWSAICNLLLVHAWGLTRRLSWNTPSWSVSAEWFAYLAVFPVCVVLMKKLSAAQAMAVSMIVWMLFVAYVLALRDGDLMQVNADGALRIIPEFFAGYATYRLVVASRSPAAGNLPTFLGLSGIVLTLLLPPAALVLLLPAILLLMIGLYRGGRLVDWAFGNAVLVFLGEISYSIYMLHMFVQIIASQIVHHLAIAPTANHARLILLAEVLSTICLGYLGYVWLEAPARRSLVARMMQFHRAPARKGALVVDGGAPGAPS
jgi:peptidoglycan/LPS O-acetylase OafA/YrhL